MDGLKPTYKAPEAIIWLSKHNQKPFDSLNKVCAVLSELFNLRLNQCFCKINKNNDLTYYTLLVIL